MRLSYFLLVVVASLLATGSAATASTEVSTMESSELTGTGQATESEKRSLRYHGNDDDEGEEEEDDDDDGEERKGGANMFDTKKLNHMLASVKRAKNGDDGGMAMVRKRFARWHKHNYNPKNLPAELNPEKYEKLRQAFHHWSYYF